jgi:hypothetical protein
VCFVRTGNLVPVIYVKVFLSQICRACSTNIILFHQNVYTIFRFPPLEAQVSIFKRAHFTLLKLIIIFSTAKNDFQVGRSLFVGENLLPSSQLRTSHNYLQQFNLLPHRSIHPA